MKFFWIIIAVKHLSLGGAPIYIGAGPYAHPTEENCLAYARETKKMMASKGHDVEVRCEMVGLTD